MKILTLNTWNEQGPWKKRWEIILEGLAALKPDIVAFQEIFKKEWALEIARKSQYPNICYADDASGLFVMSRFPVVSWFFQKYTVQSKTEGCQRSFLAVNVRAGLNNIALLNTHLSWKLGEGFIREGQIKELLGIAIEKYPKMAVILTGDFNAAENNPEMAQIEKAFFADSYKQCHPGNQGYSWDNRNTYTATHGLPDRRLDYILYKGAGGDDFRICRSDLVFTEPVGGINASDHYGVLSEFEFNGEK